MHSVHFTMCFCLSALCILRSVTLGQYLEQGQKLLLVLIRHYGWLPWRDHVAQLQASQVRDTHTHLFFPTCNNDNPKWVSSLYLRSCGVCLQSSLDAQSVRVLVVSFGSLEGSRFWLEQTGCTFNIVLDPQRTVWMFFAFLIYFFKRQLVFCSIFEGIRPQKTLLRTNQTAFDSIVSKCDTILTPAGS